MSVLKPEPQWAASFDLESCLEIVGSGALCLGGCKVLSQDGKVDCIYSIIKLEPGNRSRVAGWSLLAEAGIKVWLSGLPGPTGPSRLLYSKITAPFRPSTAPKFSSTAPFTAPIIKADYIIP
jgi:hypothetical protein